MAEYYRYYGVNIPTNLQIVDIEPINVTETIGGQTINLVPWHELDHPHNPAGKDFQEVQITGSFLFDGRHGGIIVRVIDAFGVVREASLGVLNVATPITFLYSPDYDLEIMEVDCPHDEEGFSWGNKPMLSNVSGGTGHYRFFLENSFGEKDLYICERNGYKIDSSTGAITGTPRHVSNDSGGTFFVTVKDLLWQPGQWDSVAAVRNYVEGTLIPQDATLFPSWTWSATPAEREEFYNFVVRNGNFANNTRAVIGRNLYPKLLDDGRTIYELSDTYELVALSSATIECNRERILPHFHFVDESYGAIFPIIEYRVNMGTILSGDRFWPGEIDYDPNYVDGHRVARRGTNEPQANYDLRIKIRDRYRDLLNYHGTDIDSQLYNIFWDWLPTSQHYKISSYPLVPIPNGQRINRDLSTYIEGGWRFEDTAENIGAYRFTAVGLAPDFQISQNGMISGVAKKAAPQRLAIITAEDRRGKKISHILRIGSIAAMFGFDPELKLRFPQQVMAKYENDSYTSCKLVLGVEGFAGPVDSDDTKINRLFIPADKIIGGNNDLVLTGNNGNLVTSVQNGKDFFVYMQSATIPPNLKVYLWWGPDRDRTMASLQAGNASDLIINSDHHNVYSECAIANYSEDRDHQSILRVVDTNPQGKGLNIGIILSNYSEKISIPEYDMSLVAFDKGLTESGQLSMDYAAGRQAVKIVHLYGIAPPLIWKPNTKWYADRNSTGGAITLTTTGDSPDIVPIPTSTGTAMEAYWILADGGVPNYKLEVSDISPSSENMPYVISQESPVSPTGAFIAGEIYGGMQSWQFTIMVEDSLRPYPEIEPRPQRITKRVTIDEIDIDPTFWAVDSLQGTYLIDGVCHKNTPKQITFYIGATPQNFYMIRAYFGVRDEDRFKILGDGPGEFNAYVVAANADLEIVKQQIESGTLGNAWESGSLYINNRGQLMGAFSAKTETIKYDHLIKVFYRDAFYPISNDWYGPRILPLPTKADEAWAKMLLTELQVGVYYESDPLFNLDGYDPDKIEVEATGIPDGLSFNKITGRVSGIPTTISGVSNITITLTYQGNSWTGPYGGQIVQAGGASVSGEGQLAPIIDAPLSVNVTNANLGALIAGKTYRLEDANQVLSGLIYQANGGVAPRVWTVEDYDSELFESPVLNSNGQITELTVKPNVNSTGGEIVLRVTDAEGEMIEVNITFTKIQTSNLQYNGKHGVSAWQILSDGVTAISTTLKDDTGAILPDDEILRVDEVNLTDMISGVIGALRVNLDVTPTGTQIPYHLVQGNGQIFLALRSALLSADGSPVFNTSLPLTNSDDEQLYNISLRISDDSGNVIVERLYCGDIVGQLNIEDEPWADIPRTHIGQPGDDWIEYDLTPYFSNLGEGTVTLSKEDSILSGAWRDEFDSLFKLEKEADDLYHLYYKYPTTAEHGEDQTQTLTLQFKESPEVTNVINRHIQILGVYDDVEWVRLDDYRTNKEFIPWHYLGGDASKRNEEYPSFVEIQGTSTYRIDLSYFIKYASGNNVSVTIDSLPTGWAMTNFDADAAGKLTDWHYLIWTYPDGTTECPEGYITLTLSDGDDSAPDTISLKVGEVCKPLSWSGEDMEKYEFDANGSPRGELAILYFDDVNKEWDAPEPTITSPGQVGTPGESSNPFDSDTRLWFSKILGTIEGGREVQIVAQGDVFIPDPTPPVDSLEWKNLYPLTQNRGLSWRASLDINEQIKLEWRYGQPPNNLIPYISRRSGNLISITVADIKATDSRFTKFFRLGEVYSSLPTTIDWVLNIAAEVLINTPQNINIPLATFGTNVIDKIRHYSITSVGDGWTADELIIVGDHLQLTVTAPPTAGTATITLQVEYASSVTAFTQQALCNIQVTATE